jgi:hypothetical protein
VRPHLPRAAARLRYAPAGLAGLLSCRPSGTWPCFAPLA